MLRRSGPTALKNSKVKGTYILTYKKNFWQNAQIIT